MHLVIVESPTKAKALQGFLGSGYRVLASMGHTRDLPPKELGVDIAHGFRPSYRVIPKAREVIARLREAAGQAQALTLATDPDREGEAIAWHITEVLGNALKGKPVQRATFHEITREAVQRALAAPGTLDMALVHAQQARRVLDRLVGYQVSPVLWKAIKGPHGLSAGRVQTVALRLVVERDRAIAAFVPEEYWTLEAELSKVGDERHFRARLVRIGREKPALKCEADAQAVVEALEGADYRVLKLREQVKTRRPLPPYTTSTLQQDGVNRLGWPAAKTLKVAQELYEGVTLPDEGTVGLITYMRTDSTHVAESAQEEARRVIEQALGAEYLPEQPPQYKTRARVAQEAHEAIRPTSPHRLPQALAEHLSRDQARLYELIWRRFIASQMKPAVYKVTTADVATARGGQDLPYLFRASGRELLFEGFLRVYELPFGPEARAGEGASEEDEAPAEQILPPLAEGEPLTLHGLFPEQHFTKPPPHYTEASLIKELERLGIGRPSTYAAIVRIILDRGYVRREAKALLATELGYSVCDFLVAQFPDLFAVGFTAQMEDDLDSIARGERGWVEVLERFYEPFSESVERATHQAANQPLRVARPQPVATGEACPECGGQVVVREGKYGRFRSCDNFPRCKWHAPLVVGHCPQCGGELVERKGKRGVFWGCARYPECKYVQQPAKREE
jgi:DNA topoisomerase-1